MRLTRDTWRFSETQGSWTVLSAVAGVAVAQVGSAYTEWVALGAAWALIASAVLALVASVARWLRGGSLGRDGDRPGGALREQATWTIVSFFLGAATPVLFGAAVSRWAVPATIALLALGLAVLAANGLHRASSAIPTTWALSARRGKHSAGSSTWVVRHAAQRARRGRTGVATPSSWRTRRCRAQDQARSAAAQRGQATSPAARSSSIRSWCNTRITAGSSWHGRQHYLPQHRPTRCGPVLRAPGVDHPHSTVKSSGRMRTP